MRDITSFASSALVLSLKLVCVIVLTSLLSLDPRQRKVLFSGRSSLVRRRHPCRRAGHRGLAANGLTGGCVVSGGSPLSTVLSVTSLWRGFRRVVITEY